MYCCPCTEDGFSIGYRHYPAKYMAPYWQKQCWAVAIVSACVRLLPKGGEVLWRFSDLEDEEAINRAEVVRAATKRNDRPCLVFLMEQSVRTEFVYDSHGGMQGSRFYFDLADMEPKDVRDLAEKLRDVPMSAMPRWREG